MLFVLIGMTGIPDRTRFSAHRKPPAGQKQGWRRIADDTPGTQKRPPLVCAVAFTQLSPKRYLSLGPIDTSSPHNTRRRLWHKFKGLREREGGHCRDGTSTPPSSASLSVNL